MSRFDTGAAAQDDSGRWILNPQSELPLRVQNATPEIARTLKLALEKGFSLPHDGETAALDVLAAHPDVTCVEVEQFISDLSSEFDARVVALKIEGRRPFKGRAFPWHHDDFKSLGGEMFRYIGDIRSKDAGTHLRLRAHLLSLTYTLGAYATEKCRQRKDLSDRILGWERMPMPSGCCRRCSAIATQLAPNPWPHVPMHVACGCAIFPILR